MLLHRLIDHMKQQHWTAVVLDFVIVVVGVFIGLQVNNWNQVRQERAQQHQIDLRLHSDFKLLDEQLTGALEWQEKTILALNTLRTAIKRGKALSSEDNAIKRAIAWGVAYPSFTRKSATYNELLSSGRLYLIRDDALRTALAIYNERIDNSLFNLEQVRATLTGTLIALYDHSTLSPIEPGNVGIQTALSYDIAAMAQDTEYRRRLNELIVVQTWIYTNMASQRDAIDAVEKAMEEEK